MATGGERRVRGPRRAWTASLFSVVVLAAPACSEVPRATDVVRVRALPGPKFEAPEYRADPGVVRISFSAAGASTLLIDGPGVHNVELVTRGESVSVDLALMSGRYQLMSSIPAITAAGQHATLVVSDGT